MGSTEWEGMDLIDVWGLGFRRGSNQDLNHARGWGRGRGRDWIEMWRGKVSWSGKFGK